MVNGKIACTALFTALVLIIISFFINKSTKENESNQLVASAVAFNPKNSAEELKSNEQNKRALGSFIAESASDVERARERNRIFDYSRSGNFSNTRDFLLTALREGKINEKEYFGELGHMLSIDLKDPLPIINEIIDSKNEYGFMVMVHNLSSNISLVESMTESDRASAFDSLLNFKPKLGGGIHELGLMDVFEYENWMHTIENMNILSFNAKFNDMISAGLGDPREYAVIAYAMRNNNFSGINSASRDKINDIVRRYRESCPGNSSVEALIAEMQ
jgi:hypothetical protein